MILSFATVIVVSYVTKYIFENRILSKNWDVFQCVVNFPDEMIVLKEATEGLRLTNGIPPGAIVVPGAGGGVPPIPMPGHVKHNAPGGHINPHLKIYTIQPGHRDPGGHINLRLQVYTLQLEHNVPGGHINPHLKIHREDLLLLPAADYHRLVESRSPSPLPEHADRLLGASDQVDRTAAAAAAQTSAGDQSSVDSEPEESVQPPATAPPATSDSGKEPTAVSGGKDEARETDTRAAREHRSSVTRKHP